MSDTTAPADEMALRNRLVLAAGIAAAAFVGFGLIMWVAANWDGLTRIEKLSLVGGSFGLACLAAMAHAALRIPGALVAFCAMGGLFALFGQIYQSGSDPWLLFALWAGLGLPLALAARHDAVWVPWSVVVFTAIPLWFQAVTGQPWAATLPMALASWGATAAITAALWLLGRINAGEGRWAFRLSALSVIGMVVSSALPALFATSVQGDLYILGLIATAGIGLLMWRLPPMEPGLMAAAAMAVDVLLIAGLIRLTLNGRMPDDPGTFLLIGMIAAAIVAATAALLLRVIRAPSTETGNTAPDAETVVSPRTSGHGTWPVTIMSGFGALLASIPLLIFFGLAFKDLLKDGPGIYVLALMTIAAGLVVMRISKPLGFGQQFGFIAMVVGLLLLVGGMGRDASVAFAALGIAIVLTLLALVVRIGWIQSLFGAGAATGANIFLASSHGRAYDLHFSAHYWIMIAGIAALGLAAMGLIRKAGDDTGLRAHLGRYLEGFAAGAVLGLIGSAGQTFLFGATGGLGMPRLPTPSAALSGLGAGRGLSLAMALAGCALLLWRERSMRMPVALAIMAVLAALSAVTINLGAAVLLAAVGFTFGHRALAGFAFVACLWVVGTLYYWLGWPLTQKAWLMIGLGAALGIAAAISGLSRPAAGPAVRRAALAPFLAASLIGISGLATAGIVGQGVMEKETTIASGRRVYLALAPVDPRSLIQGDYMALRFALPRLDPPARATGPDAPMQAVATLDARAIATITRIAPLSEPLAAGETGIALKLKRGQWIVGTDAWYFKEGTGKTYEKAKFGEFRLGASGDAILVGMADENLNALR